MTTSGAVTKVSSDPRSCVVQTSPGPPPVTVAFVDLTADQYATVLAAYSGNKPVTMTGTPPACTKAESP